MDAIKQYPLTKEEMVKWDSVGFAWAIGAMPRSWYDGRKHLYGLDRGLMSDPQRVMRRLVGHFQPLRLPKESARYSSRMIKK